MKFVIQPEIVAELAGDLLTHAHDRQIVLGPVAWIKSEGETIWYFHAITGPEFQTHSVELEDGSKDEATAYRNAVVLAIARNQQGGILIHDCDDELYAIRLCEALWPGEEVSRIRAAVEKERVLQ